MKWSLDTHKYISEITRKALQIMVSHGITSQSTEHEIDVVERELANAGIYRDYNGAKGRVRRALFTYFKAYGCFNSAEQLTEVGKAFCENKLSIQEFCFYFITNYKYTDGDLTYYPVELILKTLKKLEAVTPDNAYLSSYDFSKIVECDSIDDINDEFITMLLTAREQAPIAVTERQIGYDVWSKMLVNSKILKKTPERKLKVKNSNLVDWMLSAYEINNPSVMGKIDTGIISDLPIMPHGQCSIGEEYSEEGPALQAFLFDGIDSSIIEKYIKRDSDTRFEKIISDLGLSLSTQRFYKDFIGLEKLVAYRLKENEANSCRAIGSIILKSDIIFSDVQDVERAIGGTNILLYGVPGSGKSYTIGEQYCNDESRVERLVFHPDYTYSDFVGQILPNVSEGNVSYEFTEGPFTRLLKKAYDNPDEEYFLIVEEINRGNAPAIFGEVFQLLDRDDEGNSEYGISNADIARIVYGDKNRKVRIPSNMSIIGTMNTSDQNVFTLDTAFKRRWSMRMIENDLNKATYADKKILDTEVTWRQFNTVMNSIILKKNVRITSSEDKRLGAFFVRESELHFDPKENDPDASGEEKRIALLQNSLFPEKVLKYLWDDAFKFSREDVFEMNQYISLENVVRKFRESQNNDRFTVFKEEVVTALLSADEEE